MGTRIVHTIGPLDALMMVRLGIGWGSPDVWTVVAGGGFRANIVSELLGPGSCVGAEDSIAMGRRL